MKRPCASRALPSVALWGVVLLAAPFASGCADNATKLSFAIERAADRAASDPADSQTLVYTPKTHPERPYYLIFLPDRETGLNDLVSAGLPEAMAIRILREMGYLSPAPFHVVAQEGGRTTFTTHWHQFAHVPEVLVVPARGSVELELRDTGNGLVVASTAGSKTSPG